MEEPKVISSPNSAHKVLDCQVKKASRGDSPSFGGIKALKNFYEQKENKGFLSGIKQPTVVSKK